VRAKLSVLRACRRVLKPGGRIAFYTIFIPSGVSGVNRRRVLALSDPPEVASAAGYDQLLRSAGFGHILQTDATDEFLRTARAWRDARRRHALGLRRLEGEREFEQGQTNRQARLEAIEAGLLRRALLVARR